jgi:hypothetical protein
MRTAAKVDQWTTTVRRARLAVGNLGLDDLGLEAIVREHLQSLLLGELQALEWLFFLDDERNELLDLGEVLLLDGTVVGHRHVVVEAAGLLDRRADAQVALVSALQGLAQDMSRRVPEGVLALRRIELAQLQRTIALKRSMKIPGLAIDLHHPANNNNSNNNNNNPNSHTHTHTHTHNTSQCGEYQSQVHVPTASSHRHIVIHTLATTTD